jgi:hypothetical protein
MHSSGRRYWDEIKTDCTNWDLLTSEALCTTGSVDRTLWRQARSVTNIVHVNLPDMDLSDQDRKNPEREPDTEQVGLLVTPTNRRKHESDKREDQ